MLTLTNTGAAGATMTSREIADLKKSITGVYACLFSNGTIKVGRGRCIKSRVRAHKSAAACFGITIDKLAFAECGDTPGAEKKLIAWCDGVASAQTSREWFQGVDFDKCVAAMHSYAVIHAEVIERPVNDVLISFVKKFYGQTGTPESGAYADINLHLKKMEMTAEIIEFFDNVHTNSEALRKAKRCGAIAPAWLDELDIFGSWEIELFMSRDDDAGFLRILLTIIDIVNAYHENKKLETAHA